MNGIVAALDDSYSGVKRKAFEKIAEFDAKNLEAYSKQLEEVAKRAIEIVRSAKQDSYDRISAAKALRQLNKADMSTVQVLSDLIKGLKEDSFTSISAAEVLVSLDKANASTVKLLSNAVKNVKEDRHLRSWAASALGNLGKADKSVVQVLFELVKNPDEDPYVRISAAKALGQLDKVDTSVVQVLSNLVKDPKQKSYSRISAAEALGELSKADTSTVQVLSNLIKDPKEESYLRSNAAEALAKIKSLDLSQIFAFINATHDTKVVIFDEGRFNAYFYGKGEDDIKTLIRWIGRPEVFPDTEKLTGDERRKTLEVFQKAWEPSRNFPKPRTELARAIATVTSKGKWTMGDALLLEQHYKNLSSEKFSEADTVKVALDSLAIWKYFNQFKDIAIAHLAFWVALIFAYPKFPQVQAIFFWNPWVRKIGGAVYIGFLLAWVPFLRRKFFEPFRDSLLADAKLDRLTPNAYFPDSEVTLKGTDQTQPIQTVFPAIKGQSILEGDSGLGKTLFLRHLVKASQRLVVYLPAQKCEKGVIEAIQAKLHGQAQDADFLKNLIYAGAIDICIDGLNEVSADTRATIAQFVESYFKGNILITTQAIEWTPPSTAKTYSNR